MKFFSLLLCETETVQNRWFFSPDTHHCCLVSFRQAHLTANLYILHLLQNQHLQKVLLPPLLQMKTRNLSSLAPLFPLRTQSLLTMVSYWRWWMRMMICNEHMLPPVCFLVLLEKSIKYFPCWACLQARNQMLWQNHVEKKKAWPRKARRRRRFTGLKRSSSNTTFTLIWMRQKEVKLEGSNTKVFELTFYSWSVNRQKQINYWCYYT